MQMKLSRFYCYLVYWDGMFLNILVNLISVRMSERDGTDSPLHSTTYSDRLTELKSLQKLSNDWYLFKIVYVIYVLLMWLSFWCSVLLLIQEQGDLKLRVRTLESERAFQRVAAVQRTIGNVSFAGWSPSGIIQVSLMNS